MAGDEDHRRAHAAAEQLIVQVGAGHAGHADVEQHAAAPLEVGAFQECGRGRKGFDLEVGSAEEQAHGIAHRVVVVHHVDHPGRAHRGRVNAKEAPQAAFFS